MFSCCSRSQIVTTPMADSYCPAPNEACCRIGLANPPPLEATCRSSRILGPFLMVRSSLDAHLRGCQLQRLGDLEQCIDAASHAVSVLRRWGPKRLFGDNGGKSNQNCRQRCSDARNHGPCRCSRFSKIRPCLQATFDVSGRRVFLNKGPISSPLIKIVPNPAHNVWSVLLTRAVFDSHRNDSFGRVHSGYELIRD
jgi:hypothetical protein